MFQVATHGQVESSFLVDDVSASSVHELIVYPTFQLERLPRRGPESGVQFACFLRFMCKSPGSGCGSNCCAHREEVGARACEAECISKLLLTLFAAHSL